MAMRQAIAHAGLREKALTARTPRPAAIAHKWRVPYVQEMIRTLTLCLAALPCLTANAALADPQLISAARSQVGVTVTYDPSYQSLAFPGGDVAQDRGVCTDVVIRALRQAWGIDLQLATNRDMKAAFGSYPKTWGLKTTDRNIDHRRVPNLQTLLARVGAALPVTSDPSAFLPGDIVTWMLPGNLPHIGILSDKMAGGHPLVLHNIGAGAREEDRLFDFKITGHYRINDAAHQRLQALN